MCNERLIGDEPTVTELEGMVRELEKAPETVQKVTDVVLDLLLAKYSTDTKVSPEEFNALVEYHRYIAAGDHDFFNNQYDISSNGYLVSAWLLKQTPLPAKYLKRIEMLGFNSLTLPASLKEFPREVFKRGTCFQCSVDRSMMVFKHTSLCCEHTKSNDGDDWGANDDWDDVTTSAHPDPAPQQDPSVGERKLQWFIAPPPPPMADIKKALREMKKETKAAAPKNEPKMPVGALTEYLSRLRREKAVKMDVAIKGDEKEFLEQIPPCTTGEYRRDTDNKLYTKREFMLHYGSVKEWDKASSRRAK
eukprot:TRINITY_DN33643_c0_g1_i1.p1 TRINITY_DN33643_c0_g1~~TRINITY_DN33643_c0_g1_i1.p1  ORF type:complete len:328 (+),score=85.31 TRINITY_DN33643_c0_g1_i1:70-984(+)